MVFLGVIVWVVVSGLALLVDNPPEGIPLETLARGDSRQQRPRLERAFSWREMLSAPQFWLLFVMYFAGAAVGLMFISVAQDLGR